MISVFVYNLRLTAVLQGAEIFIDDSVGIPSQLMCMFESVHNIV
jgi:hypothetical protein